MEFPGGGQALDRQFQGARLLGEGQPDELPVAAVGASLWADRQSGESL